MRYKIETEEAVDPQMVGAVVIAITTDALGSEVILERIPERIPEQRITDKGDPLKGNPHRLHKK
jgi:hypothetical protein